MFPQLRNATVKLDAHIARVELGRPPVNALNREFVGELTDLALALSTNPEVWLVVVTSSQNVFCAGADLKERAGIADAEVLDVVGGIQRLARLWGELPQPVMMGIRGAALGGGLEFALAADILAAAEDTRLGLPEVSLGIIPAAGGTQRLAIRCSLGVARKWVLTARQFTAAEALTDGVVDYVFPPGKFREDFEGLVTSLASNAPLALRQAKAALNDSSKRLLAGGFQMELDSYAPLVSTSDRREALKAFAEKRAPRWKGT
jgi:enoyl-CoA hydratase/carnithine racemase